VFQPTCRSILPVVRNRKDGTAHRFSDGYSNEC
jgi:hypothetical protein